MRKLKKDFLGHADLDSKSLNNTISLIETTEMSTRAMPTAGCNSDFNMAVQRKQKSSKDLDIKLATETKCKACDKQMQKFMLRKDIKRLESLAIALTAGQRNALMVVTPTGQYLML